MTTTLMPFSVQRAGFAGYPSSAGWLNEVLNANSRVGAYPNYVATGIVCRRFYNTYNRVNFSLASFSRIFTCHVISRISLCSPYHYSVVLLCLQSTQRSASSAAHKTASRPVLCSCRNTSMEHVATSTTTR